MKLHALIAVFALGSLAIAQETTPPQAGPQSAKAVEWQIPFETLTDRLNLEKTGGNMVITNARILTVTNGEILNGSIVVSNGRIVAVGEKVTIPKGVKVFDAGGRIVTPGLIDAHTHLASDSTNEGADAVTPEVRILDVLNPQSRSFYEKVSCGTTSSLILHGSANPIGGESLIVKHKWRRTVEQIVFPGAPRVVKFALGENVTRMNSLTANTRFPATRMGVEAVYRRAFTQAQQYKKNLLAWEKNKRGPKPRRDLRLEALVDMLDGKIIIHCHAYRQDEMLMLLQVAKDFGLKLVAFQHALESYKIAPEIAASGTGVSLFVDHWGFKIEGFDTIPHAAAILTRNGILTSVNTDTSGGPTPFQLDATKTIRFGGVSPTEALKMVTINPAKQLQIDKQVGSIEPGKMADLVIWDGHPLSVYSRARMTFIDGEMEFQRRSVLDLDLNSKFVNSVKSVTNDVPLIIPDSKGDYALVGGTVFSMAGPSQSATVLIRDGKIANVDPSGTVPAGATIIDVRGLSIYPGLIDAGTDIGIQEVAPIKAMNDFNELGRFQPDLIALTAVNPESAKLDVAKTAGLTTVLTRPSGTMISGQSSIINLAGWNNRELGVKPKAGLQIRFPEGVGALNIFVQDTISDEQRSQFQSSTSQDRAELKAYFEKAKRYSLAKAANPDLPLDLRLEAMLPYISGELPVIVSAQSPTGIKEAVGFFKALGVRMILEGARESYRVADFLAKEKIPVLLPVPMWGSPTASGQVNPPKDWDPIDIAFRVPALLAKAGVKFAFQSNDSGQCYNLPYRVGVACAYGLSYERALKALTSDAAEILGIGGEQGTIEEGKTATLIITDGDPLEITTQVKGMFINGKAVKLETRWTRLYNKYKVR